MRLEKDARRVESEGGEGRGGERRVYATCFLRFDSLSRIVWEGGRVVSGSLDCELFIGRSVMDVCAVCCC